MTTKHLSRHRKVRPDLYMELVLAFPLRPIRSESDHRAALDAARGIMLRDERDLSADEADYLDVLSDLIRQYEEAHYLMPKNSGTERDRLVALMDDSGMTASDLGRLLGTRSLGSMLLTGRRGLSKSHIRILANHFKIDPGYFLS